ncbi:response regulator transcription factor [Iodidimonas sp. SYSU 1G8]|uniref:response regulator transcription factor n=1 Tax=Iodidimonas sp. SYSU 1G8 TaxID=3133967 RepID=UPI0031FE7AA4
MSAPVARILVIDDEPQIRRFLRISLAAGGYDVVEAGTAAEGISRHLDTHPDLIVVDLGLPDMDGQDVVSRIRARSETPIIVLSVRAGERDKIEALNRGANDYVTKPFGIGEFMARIRATLRARNAPSSLSAPFTVGPVSIDLATRKVSMSGAPVKLTRKEFELLRLLVVNAGRVLTHQYLLQQVWGPAHLNDSHYLRIYIGHLRQKLGDDPADPKLIVTELGVGYRLVDEPR